MNSWLLLHLMAGFSVLQAQDLSKVSDTFTFAPECSVPFIFSTSRRFFTSSSHDHSIYQLTNEIKLLLAAHFSKWPGICRHRFRLTGILRASFKGWVSGLVNIVCELNTERMKPNWVTRSHPLFQLFQLNLTSQQQQQLRLTFNFNSRDHC